MHFSSGSLARELTLHPSHPLVLTNKFSEPVFCHCLHFYHIHHLSSTACSMGSPTGGPHLKWFLSGCSSVDTAEVVLSNDRDIADMTCEGKNEAGGF